MESSERVVIYSGDEEEEHVNRLMALLHKIVRREGGRSGAARALGMDRRTVGTCIDDGRLTPGMRKALELALREEADSDSARPEPNDAPERRFQALREELHKDLDADRGEIKALREEVALTLEKVQGLLASREAQQENHRESPWSADTPNATGSAPKEATATDKPKFTKRLYPELVTMEPAPDDEVLFGKAWPLIEEWREIWKAGHVGTGKGLAWLETEERVRELEVAMLEEHGLTLPPEKQPLHGLWRSTQLDWRRETLNEVRRAVAWRHLLRKALTCGLWRSRWWRGSA